MGHHQDVKALHLCTICVLMVHHQSLLSFRANTKIMIRPRYIFSSVHHHINQSVMWTGFCTLLLLLRCKAFLPCTPPCTINLWGRKTTIAQGLYRNTSPIQHTHTTDQLSHNHTSTHNFYVIMFILTRPSLLKHRVTSYSCEQSELELFVAYLRRFFETASLISGWLPTSIAFDWSSKELASLADSIGITGLSMCKMSTFCLLQKQS